MFIYEKKLQFPVKISTPNPKLAAVIISQFGVPDVNNVIRFLREREIVHFQRFGECLRMCKEKMNAKNVYLTNPAFDKIQPRDQGRG